MDIGKDICDQWYVASISWNGEEPNMLSFSDLSWMVMLVQSDDLFWWKLVAEMTKVIFYAWSSTILGRTYGSVQVWWDAVVCMLLGNINVLRNFEEKVPVDIPWRNVNEILVVAWSRRVVLFPVPMKYFPKKKKYSYSINSKMIDVMLLGFGSWYMVAKFRYR